MSKQIILCADDFAQNKDISDGIILLARDKRINAISCLVNGSYWDEASSELTTIDYKGYVGLHLNLTKGQPLSAVWRKCEGEEFYSLPVLLKKLLLRKIKRSTIEAEIQAQIDVFTHLMHIYPDFIDGYQHVHQLPIVRDVLLTVHNKVMGHTNFDDDSSEEDLLHTDSFFRNTVNGFSDIFSVIGFPKSQALNIGGGQKFKKLLTAEQIPTNASFAGTYNYKNARNYRKYFQRFLKKTKNGGIIICHPGSFSKDVSDPLHRYRFHELTYLMSDVFLTDMEDNFYSLAFKK